MREGTRNEEKKSGIPIIIIIICGEYVLCRIYGCSRLISWVLKIVCVRVEGVRVEGVRVEGVRVEGGGGRSMDRIENNQLKRVPRSFIL